MNLLGLAPDIQEELLFLPTVERGRDPLVLRDLLVIAAEPDWQRQRRLWRGLIRGSGFPGATCTGGRVGKKLSSGTHADHR